MQESDYIVGYAPFEYLPHGNRNDMDVIGHVVEEYVWNPNTPLHVIAKKFGIDTGTVSAYIDLVLFNRPEIPVVITLKSRV